MEQIHSIILTYSCLESGHLMLNTNCHLEGGDEMPFELLRAFGEETPMVMLGRNFQELDPAAMKNH